MYTYQTIQVYIKFNLLTFRARGREIHDACEIHDLSRTYKCQEMCMSHRNII